MDRSNHTAVINSLISLRDKVAPISEQLVFSDQREHMMSFRLAVMKFLQECSDQKIGKFCDQSYTTHIRFRAIKWMIMAIKWMISPLRSSFLGPGHVLSHIHPDTYDIRTNRRVPVCLLISFSYHFDQGNWETPWLVVEPPL